MSDSGGSLAAALLSLLLVTGGLGVVGSLVGCTGERDVDQPAPLASQKAIEYPLELWDQDVEGRTLLRVRVDEVGRVDSAVVLQSSGYPAFDSAALEGARSMRFEPAKKGEERIPVWARVPVHFSKDSPPDSLPPR